MHRSEWLTVPNVVSLLRLCTVPLFVSLRVTGRVEAALVCFIAAAWTDWVDGLLARVLNQKTRVGALLDPIADKVLVLSALVVLAVQGQVPLWLIGLVLFRDAWMIIGAAFVRAKRLDLPASPSRIGKYATLALSALCVLALARPSAHAPAELGAYIPAVGWIAGLCVAVSTLQYFARYGYLFFAPSRRPPSPPPPQTAR